MCQFLAKVKGYGVAALDGGPHDMWAQDQPTQLSIVIELCTPVSASTKVSMVGFSPLQPTTRSYPRCRLSTYGTRFFSVVSPVCWNSLPDYLKSPDISFNTSRQQSKTFFLFCTYWHLL